MTKIKISKETRSNYNPDGGGLLCWEWCIDKLGMPGNRWSWDTYKTFEFKNEKDAMLFALIWS